ncbi:cytidine deaminase-like protein [Syncephalis plumigaleata]|nr:cytidine deaminase-like protein [Syncephalis plumigaleata]
MLLGIVGPSCSGKHALAQLLVENEGFQRLDVNPLEEHVIYDDANNSDDNDNNDAIVFPNDKSLIAYVTTRWQKRYVTCDIHTIDTIKQYRHRPFFLLLSIDAPILVRYARYQARTNTTVSLEFFLNNDDIRRFGSVASAVSLITELPDHSIPTPVSTPDIRTKQMPTPSSIDDAMLTLMQQADIHISNHYTVLSDLYQHVMKLDLTNSEWLRPGWDSYFMMLAELAALRSNCMKRRVGCIVVKAYRVIASGYNGTPRGLPNCNERGCTRCNSGAQCGSALDTCLCLHAEENALLEAGRERIQDGDCTLYCNTCPCLGCAKRIIQMGIKQVVYAQSYGMDTATATLFMAAGVQLRQHPLVSIRIDRHCVF